MYAVALREEIGAPSPSWTFTSCWLASSNLQSALLATMDEVYSCYSVCSSISFGCVRTLWITWPHPGAHSWRALSLSQVIPQICGPASMPALPSVGLWPAHWLCWHLCVQTNKTTYLISAPCSLPKHLILLFSLAVTKGRGGSDPFLFAQNYPEQCLSTTLSLN